MSIASSFLSRQLALAPLLVETGADEVAAPGAVPEFIPAEEVIHLKYPNPLDPHCDFIGLASQTNLANEREYRFNPPLLIVCRNLHALSCNRHSRLRDASGQCRGEFFRQFSGEPAVDFVLSKSCRPMAAAANSVM
jgi:hypothetical protein